VRKRKWHGYTFNQANQKASVFSYARDKYSHILPDVCQKYGVYVGIIVKKDIQISLN
jgi:hypothetical protein